MGSGLMEFAGVDKAARSKMRVWKMQEWTYQHDVARVDIAGGNKKLSYCWETVRRESMPRIAEMDVEMTT